MLDSETINFMFTHFIAITNGLVFLNKTIFNDQMIRKIIRALLKSWWTKPPF